MALACEGAIEYRGGFRAYHDYRLTLRHYKRTKASALTPHPVKIDLNKKLDPKQKTIQAFNIDA